MTEPSGDQQNVANLAAVNGKLTNIGTYIMASSGLALLISVLTIVAYKLRPKIRKYILPRT